MLNWRKWRAPNNASKWQMGFNSGFKGLKTLRRLTPCIRHFGNRTASIYPAVTVGGILKLPSGYAVLRKVTKVVPCRLVDLRMFRDSVVPHETSLINSRQVTRWRSWSRHCATSRKVAGSIPDGVSGIFHRLNLLEPTCYERHQQV